MITKNKTKETATKYVWVLLSYKLGNRNAMAGTKVTIDPFSTKRSAEEWQDKQRIKGFYAR